MASKGMLKMFGAITKHVDDKIGENLTNAIFKNKVKTPIQFYDPKIIAEDNELQAKLLYLYWACYRGRIDIV